MPASPLSRFALLAVGLAAGAGLYFVMPERIPPSIPRLGLGIFGLIMVATGLVDVRWSDDMYTPEARWLENFVGRRAMRWASILMGIAIMAFALWSAITDYPIP